MNFQPWFNLAVENKHGPVDTGMCSTSEPKSQNNSADNVCVANVDICTAEFHGINPSHPRFLTDVALPVPREV